MPGVTNRPRRFWLGFRDGRHTRQTVPAAPADDTAPDLTASGAATAGLTPAGAVTPGDARDATAPDATDPFDQVG